MYTSSNSVTVIGEDKIIDKASAAFEEVIGKVPNVNFSSAGSRAHHIQIRGIGETSQFQYPLNPSVGINIDGMDFSNSAFAVTLFDVKQIEVLKGPQGTTFGANGMAGVVNIESNDPTKETQGHIEATVGNYNTKAVGAAIGGTLIEDTLLGRFSIYKNKSDGFIENSFLNKKDVNNIDELTAKAKLRWLVADNHTIDFNFMHLNFDNGYDAFTLDNSRTSHSDAGGTDTLKTNAFSIKSNYKFNAMKLLSSLDWSDSKSKYSYDNDWSYAGEVVDGVEQYVGDDAYNRTRKNIGIDVRLVSEKDARIFNNTTSWTIGMYYQERKHTLDRLSRYSEPFYKQAKYLNTKYETKSTSLYGQLDTELSDKLTLITGVRAEKWKATYSDTRLKVADYSPDKASENTIDYDEVLYGGKIGLNYQMDKKTLLYTMLSRGYKPGGVNIDTALTEEQKTYNTEILWNLEAGVNSSHLNDTLKSRLNIFYAKRKDQQIGSSAQDGAEFTTYLANAAKGYNYGIESELDYYPTDSLHVYSSVGLLKTKFDEYNNPDPTAYNLTGREQAQSPRVQYNIGFDTYFADNWSFNANVEGKSSYFFGNESADKISGYTLVNASLGYTTENWSVNLWVRNIADKDYAVKGYYFDNKIAGGWDDAEVFTQKGAPRTFGLTLGYDF